MQKLSIICLYLYRVLYVLIRTNYINTEKYASGTSHKCEILKWHKGRGMRSECSPPSDLWVCGALRALPDGSVAKPRRKTNLVHSDTCIRPLVAATFILDQSWGGIASQSKLHIHKLSTSYTRQMT